MLPKVFMWKIARPQVMLLRQISNFLSGFEKMKKLTYWLNL